jgi:hypothetical protein
VYFGPGQKIFCGLVMSSVSPSGSWSFPSFFRRSKSSSWAVSASACFAHALSGSRRGPPFALVRFATGDAGLVIRITVSLLPLALPFVPFVFSFVLDGGTEVPPLRLCSFFVPFVLSFVPFVLPTSSGFLSSRNPR